MGTTFTIGPPRQGRSQIIVGSGAALTLGLPAKNLAGLGNESFYSGYFASPMDGSIVLSGGVGGLRGTLYAVYHMLTDVLNFQFLAHDETIIPQCPDFIPHYETTTHPAFEYRANNQYQVSEQTDWDARVGYNGVGDTAHGGHVSYASPPGFVHTSYNLLTFPKMDRANTAEATGLYDTHPAWFWPRGAAGAKAYGQLCWSNASLVTFLTSQVRAVLRAQPDANIVSISQNDNGQRCLDPVEEAVNNKSGSPIGALLTAVNQIAADIEVDFPHVAIDTLAYQWSRPAPTSVLKPRHNVIVRLCSIECDFAHPFTHPNNAPFKKDLVDWAAKTNRTYIWNYVTNFQHYVAPFPNWHVLAPNIKFLHAHGVKGLFEEGTYGTSGGDLVQLKDYVMAKALWDPAVDAEALMSNFIEGYYGAAAEPIEAYMAAMVQGISDASYYMHESFNIDAPFLTPALLLTSATAFGTARSAVAKGDVRFVHRVEEAAMPVMYVVLFRWDEVKAHAGTAGVPWPYNATMRPQFEEFKRCYARLGIIRLDEGGHNITWMEQQLFPSSTPLPLPPTVEENSKRAVPRIGSLHWPRLA